MSKIDEQIAALQSEEDSLIEFINGLTARSCATLGYFDRIIDVRKDLAVLKTRRDNG